MADTQNKWMAQIEAFFAEHPRHEYMIHEMPMEALDAVTSAKWAVGSASRAPANHPSLTNDGGQRKVACIARRADPAEGRHLPGVHFLDGSPTLPPPPKSADQSRGDENFVTRQKAR